MVKPWELPWAEVPHHAVPLAGGTWRGPSPLSSACQGALAAMGVIDMGRLPDGSSRYGLVRAADIPVGLEYGDLENPAYRAHWIAARLAAGGKMMALEPAAPQLLGILNLTNDSFSDGGKVGPGGVDLSYRAQCLAIEQVDIFDLGAESTRPGAQAVPDQVQVERLLPAIEQLLPLGKPLSIDTRSAAVAAACLEAGASMINDVSGLADPKMAPLIARHGCKVFAMHMRGTPATMQEHCDYDFLMGELADELMQIAQVAFDAGIESDQLVLDPGIGFAKTAAQSREIVADFGALRALGLPLLAGPSRKSFMADLLPHCRPDQRDGGSFGAAALCAAQGASFIRLHRGGRGWDAVRVAAACAFPNQNKVVLQP
ncbi:MAG: dihydropteroate synthase [Planctomycetes bacterium]|nr:dihydropteroate synthase [Planctomycetota bacterium]MCP4771447.1 dihydropteroate synthase [Planctomycetota bacterium]MCP4861108.1 dihydropteroate synthase [Planctomycetota bacterium]